MSSSHLPFLVILSSFLNLAASQSSTASPSLPPTDDCMTLLFGSADCLPYVEEGSNLTIPDKPCCPELGTLLSTNPVCFCDLLKKGANNLGIAIDVKKAMTLPAACKLGAPLCSGKAPHPTEEATSVNKHNGAAPICISATTFVVALVAILVEYVLS